MYDLIYESGSLCDPLNKVMTTSSFKYDVCIVGGAGRVGLPLGLCLAQAGNRVMLHDVNENVLSMLNRGKMPFLDEGAEQILNAVLDKTLDTGTSIETVAQSKFIVFVIGTGIDEHLTPRLNDFLSAFERLLPLLSDRQHVILRSTVFPGTTEVIKGYFESRGLQPRLSYCPERIAQGKAVYELRHLPQIIGTFDEDSRKEAAGLFSSLTPDLIFLTPFEAELTKLFTNTWRYIEFAIANQLYQIAAKNKVDFYRLYQAITYNYPRAAGFPSAGFSAGPCLFKDTMQLTEFSTGSFFLGHAAMMINDGMPNFIVETLKNRHRLKELTVGILGMAFKANNDDKRESLSYKLKRILEIEAKRVYCTDPYISDPEFVPVEECIRTSDILIVGAPHSHYRSLDIPAEKEIADIWNFYGKGGLF